MGAQINVTKSPSNRATCRICDKPIARGLECVVIENLHVSPRYHVKLFFHYLCFSDAVKAAELVRDAASAKERT